MSIYGSTLTSESSNIFSLSSISYDAGVHGMYSGIDWIYTHVESLYIYDYKIIYFLLLNNVYDESMDFFFLAVWYMSIQTSGLQLF